MGAEQLADQRSIFLLAFVKRTQDNKWIPNLGNIVLCVNHLNEEKQKHSECVVQKYLLILFLFFMCALLGCFPAFCVLYELR